MKIEQAVTRLSKLSTLILILSIAQAQARVGTKSHLTQEDAGRDENVGRDLKKTSETGNSAAITGSSSSQSSCLYLQQHVQYAEGAENVGPDVDYKCQLDDGTVLPLTGPGRSTVETASKLPSQASDAARSAETRISLADATISANSIYLPNKDKVIIPGGGTANNPNNKRHLLGTTGTKPVIVVRVIATDSSTEASAAELSDAVFGTHGDKVSLRSQMKACSYGRINFVPGTGPGVVDGVVTVNIGIAANGQSTNTVQNAVTSALKSLGFAFPNPATASATMYMYAFPKATYSSGWIAYAYLNWYISVYNNNWATFLSAQMHEVGHNSGLHHAGVAGATSSSGLEYGDQSGMMGYSYGQDDGPLMCFNPAKSWQLGWYSSYHRVLSPMGMSVGANRYTNMIGVADRGKIASGQKVVLKLNTNTEVDYYIGFNRATGINEGTVKNKDMVLIEQQGGEGTSPSKSLLLAAISVGAPYTISNFGGSNKNVIVAVDSITTSLTGVQVAKVRMTVA